MLRIGLASYEFKNNQVDFNLKQIENAMNSVKGKVDLICFGETFLQGFDALNWNYEHDKEIAISLESETMNILKQYSLDYKIDLCVGYVEKEGDCIYSSCLFIESGKIIHNYRRITKGWKEYLITDEHYKEGNESLDFSYKGHTMRIALCGDMWDIPETFKTEGILLWPIYVNFSLDDWKVMEIDYAKQSLLASKKALLINSISFNPDAHGGAFYFMNGKIKNKLDFDKEDVLIIEI